MYTMIFFGQCLMKNGYRHLDNRQDIAQKSGFKRDYQLSVEICPGFSSHVPKTNESPT